MLDEKDFPSSVLAQSHQVSTDFFMTLTLVYFTAAEHEEKDPVVPLPRLGNVIIHHSQFVLDVQGNATLATHVREEKDRAWL